MLSGPGFGYDVLGQAECTALLGKASHGHLGISVGAMPMVLPVFYRLFEGHVVYRPTYGPEISSATTNAVVAFQVDALDPESGEGWTVVVQGIAAEATAYLAEQMLATTPANGRANEANHRLVALPIERITGYRIHRLPPDI
jgi:uncharacterized protein